MDPTIKIDYIPTDVACSVCYLLPIQELHERPQHVVSVCLCSVGVGWAFNLVQDLSHLTHAAVNTSLKTGGRGNNVRRENFCKVPPRESERVRERAREIPLGKYDAEVVQEGAELHLQLIEDVCSLCIQLQHTEKKNRR